MLHQRCVLASNWVYWSHSAFWNIQSMKRQHTTFHARVGPVWSTQKPRWDTSCRTCVFASSVIHASRSTFLLHPRHETSKHYFHARVGPVRIPQKKHVRTFHAKLVFVHLVWFAGRIVGSGASGAWNVDALFSCSCGPSTDLTKSTPRHVTTNLCFCI
jgi:hypothetical protein